MALTVDSVVKSVREIVEGSEPRNRPYSTFLTNAPGAAGTTFGVGTGDAWQVGDLVEGPAGELSQVTAITNNDLTVVRAQGSIAAETLALGNKVYKNPRFSYQQVKSAIQDVVDELNTRVYRLGTETIAYTTDDFYDVADTAMEQVFSAWYLDNGNFYVCYYSFMEDPANTQPKIFLAAAGYTGNIFVNYARAYADVTEIPDRLKNLIVAGVTYKLMGGAVVHATEDTGKRTDRTVQGGQESRDSYWWYREFVRLRDAEAAYLRHKVKALPTDRLTQRARRFQK